MPMPVVCDETNEILDKLIETRKETPIFVGRSSDQKSKAKIVLFVNKSTSTWSIVLINESVACVIGLGEGFKQPSSNTI